MRKAQRFFTRKSARSWFIVTVIAMVGITIGAAFAASALVPHTLTQTVSGFQTNFVEVPAFTPSTAQLIPTFATPTGPCTTPGVPGTAIPITTTAVTSYYNAITSSGSCNQGDFSEAFNIFTAAGTSATAGSWYFNFTLTSSPSASVTTVYTLSTVYSTTASTTVVLLTIYLEFGASIPAYGIQAVTLVVTPA